MPKPRECVLYEGRVCEECGECDRCDINPEKTCDNCMQCVQGDADFMAVRIDGVLTPEESLENETEEDGG